MTRFTRIIIRDYKSIGYAEILPEAGIYKVVGENLDTTYTSNGAAKSSSVQAIMLCLYNRDFTGLPLDYLSNRYTKKAWNLEVHFSYINGKDSYDIVVKNQRKPNNMTLTIDGVLTHSGASKVVPEVERMLGMGWETFKLTHFITSKTITDLTENLSNPQIFNDVLHLVELQELDKKLRTLSTEVNKEYRDAEKDYYHANRVKSLAELGSKYNKEELNTNLVAYREQLEELDSRFGESSFTLREDIDKNKHTLGSLGGRINTIKSTIRNGVCSTCGTILVDTATYSTMNIQLDKLTQELNDITNKTEALEAKYGTYNIKYTEARAEINQFINKAEADLLAATEISSITTSDTSIDFSTIENTYNELASTVDIMELLRKQIKSGGIIDDIMTRFFSLVQVKVSQYAELISLEQFSVRVKASKLGMEVILLDGQEHIPVESLSNGEKTRLSLLLLVSILDAMKQVSDSETNYLVFDEASASFDKSGVDELSRLFTYLKYLEQSVFLITHGSELEDVPYNFELKATKRDGVSSLTVTNL